MKTNLKITGCVLMIFLGLISKIQAQDGPGKDKIEAAKIGLISERLGLSPEQAEKFWPVYNEYSLKRRENHRQYQNARRDFNPDQASEQETKQMLDLGRQTKERQLKLEKEYSDRLLLIISTRQLMSLHEAERDFRDMLLRRLDQRRMQQQGKEQFRRENLERLRNKRNN